MEKQIFPCYVMSLLFLFAYGLALVLYLLDVHYLTEEVEYDGEIKEPMDTYKNGVKPMNIGDIDFYQMGAFVVAIPLLLIYQIWDAVVSICKMCYSTCDVYYTMYNIRAEDRKKRKSVLTRLFRTVIRLLREFWLVV